MKRFLPLFALPLLAACGGDDPTPEAGEAASAEAINVTVEQAENTAEAAEEKAEAANGE